MKKIMFMLVCLGLLLAGCGTAEPEAVVPTNTPKPEPTKTPIPPTSTPLPTTGNSPPHSTTSPTSPSPWTRSQANRSNTKSTATRPFCNGLPRP